MIFPHFNPFTGKGSLIVYSTYHRTFCWRFPGSEFKRCLAGHLPTTGLAKVGKLEKEALEVGKALAAPISLARRNQRITGNKAGKLSIDYNYQISQRAMNFTDLHSTSTVHRGFPSANARQGGDGSPFQQWRG